MKKIIINLDGFFSFGSWFKKICFNASQQGISESSNQKFTVKSFKAHYFPNVRAFLKVWRIFLGVPKFFK